MGTGADMSGVDAGSDGLDTFDVGPGGDPRNPEPNVPAASHPDTEASQLLSDRATPDPATVEALGLLSEAVEWVERARGSLYDFHHRTGHADDLLCQAADAFDRAGHVDQAAALRSDLIGRDVLAGRWTFQVVDEYDDMYWTPVRSVRHQIESDLAGGRRHVHAAAMKRRRHSPAGEDPVIDRAPRDLV